MAPPDSSREGSWSNPAWTGGRWAGEAAGARSEGWASPARSFGNWGHCDGDRGGSARDSRAPRARREARGSIRSGRLGSTTGCSSRGAIATAAGSASATGCSSRGAIATAAGSASATGPGSSLAEPLVGIFEGTGDGVSRETAVATLLLGDADVRSEAKRVGLFSDVPSIVRMSVLATAPRAVPPKRKRRRRSGLPRFLPTACRHLRNCSSRSCSSDSGSSLSFMNHLPNLPTYIGRGSNASCSSPRECQKHNGRASRCRDDVSEHSGGQPDRRQCR
jgi:hypothetical protein